MEENEYNENNLLIMDYSGRDIDESNISDIIEALKKNEPPVYEINLLETGITEKQILRLYPFIINNSSLVIFKIQTYEDHSFQIKDIIVKMRAHIRNNESNNLNDNNFRL